MGERRAWLDRLAVFLGSALVYAMLAQRSFYTSDGQLLLQRVLLGQWTYHNHWFGAPLLILWTRALGAFGVPVYEAALALAVVTSAGAVALGHAAAGALGLGRDRALLAAALAALAPSAMFFASVVEYHAPFLLVANAALYVATRAGRSGSIGGAAAAGLLGAISFLLHSSGVLLAALVVPWLGAVAARSGAPRGAVAGRMAVAALAHGFGCFLLRAALQPHGFGPFPAPGEVGMLQAIDAASVARVPHLIWAEWLEANAPLSFAALLLFWPRRVRGLWLALVLGLLAFLALCVAKLVGLDERGAYMLPLVAPAALLVAGVMTRRVIVPLLLLGALLGVRQVRAHDRLGPVYAQRIATIRELDRERPVQWWIGDQDDLAAVIQGMPQWIPEQRVALLLDAVLYAEAQLENLPELLPAVAASVEAQGRQLVVSAQALAWLDEIAPRHPLAPRVGALIRASVSLVELRGGAWRVYRVEPRR